MRVAPLFQKQEATHMHFPTSISTLKMWRVSSDVIRITHASQVKKIIGTSLIVYLAAILHAFMMMVGSLEKVSDKVRTFK